MWLLAAAAQAQEVPPDSPRRTDTVRLIERCLPAVVLVRTFSPHENPGVFYVNVGSGAVVHEAGYILTNAHVVKNMVRGEAQLASGRSYPYRIVASFAPEDLALLKIDADEPLSALPLGRSHDLLLGEPVLVIGSPDNLAQSCSTGIVSGLNRATATPDAFLPWTIQTNAAINGGNSGGPLINALGELIGIITSKKNDADNIGFAIAVDRARQVLPAILAAEERYGFQLGLAVDMLGGSATVAAVAAESPAAAAGLQPGDIVRRLDDAAVRHGLDFHLALVERQAGQTLALEIERQGQTLPASVTLAPVALPQPVADEGLANGLDFAAYQGTWAQLPDFSALSPAATGRAEKPALAAYPAASDNLGLVFSGFVKVPGDGLYTFYLTSDDGSRLWIGNRLIVDNDGLHAAREAAGLVRLPAGLHPIRIEFFEAGGAEALAVALEGPQMPKAEIPPAAFFARAPAAAAGEPTP